MKRRPITAGLFATVLAGSISSSVLAQPSATPDAAAKQWLLYIDGGDYAKGWDRAGSPFKAQMAAPVLQGKLAPVREPLGAIMQRKLFQVTLSNTAPGLPEGKYAAVQFRSRFANKATAGETVWLDMENNHWAVIGYFIGPDIPKNARPPVIERDQSQQPAEVATIPGTKSCTHQQMAEARIARMNGYTGGPKCSLPE